ncbi:transcriptional regulator [Lichenicoccus roseus]|uniref:Transcriptional regulator n=1 Tax=Lichenicoccus roseus TaxID=2683649 RepID=A0A5R9J513_9PROT|nr:transcriptional regulator [Lichenicoccus roseus]
MLVEDQAESDIVDTISPAQVRAARGLLDWTRDQLVASSGVPKSTLVRFEDQGSRPRGATLSALRRALEAAGVEFIQENGGGAGVRLRLATV